MASQNNAGAHPDDDDLDDSLWDADPTTTGKPEAASANKTGGKSASRLEQQQSHDEQLKQELASVRKVNETIEGVIASLERAKGNMKTVNQTVGAASTLLNTWARILSQTEHNQRLILDPAWPGASQDLADIENEAVAKQQAAQRREAEEQERKSTAARRAEEEEKRRTTESRKQQKSSLKVRGRVTGRGAASTGYVGGDTTINSSNIGRGVPGTRRTTSGVGRGRGTRGRT